VKEWLKSVLNYQSYPKNKTGYPFLEHPVHAWAIDINMSQCQLSFNVIQG